MTQDQIQEILSLARRKQIYDYEIAPTRGSAKYLAGIQKEITEVQEEIEKNRTCYLEDEMGDLFWNFLNIACALEKEKNISIDRIWQRCIQKYRERMDGLEQGKGWAEVKAQQKKRLEIEYSRQNS